MPLHKILLEIKLKHPQKNMKYFLHLINCKIPCETGINGLKQAKTSLLYRFSLNSEAMARSETNCFHINETPGVAGGIIDSPPGSEISEI